MPDIDGTGKPRWPTWRGSPCLAVPLRGHQGGTARANDVREREQIAPAGQVRMSTHRAERQPAVSDQVVTYESIDGIAVITLNRPHRLNAVVPELVERLCAAGGISRLLPLTVGMAKAKELVLLGERFSAEQALEFRLINWVVGPGEHLGFAMDLAARLGARPRSALARAKHALDLGPEVGIEAAFEVEISSALALHTGADAQDAARAFRDRGSPAVENTGAAGHLEKCQ